MTMPIGGGGETEEFSALKGQPMSDSGIGRVGEEAESILTEGIQSLAAGSRDRKLAFRLAGVTSEDKMFELGVGEHEQVQRAGGEFGEIV
jgi:hypothetical protein